MRLKTHTFNLDCFILCNLSLKIAVMQNMFILCSEHAIIFCLNDVSLERVFTNIPITLAPSMVMMLKDRNAWSENVDVRK